MNRKFKRIFRSAMTGFLTVAICITNIAGTSMTAYAADLSTSATVESSKTEQRTVTLGNFQYGSLAFADSKKSSVDFNVGDSVTINVMPDGGYFLKKIAILDESDNLYSYMSADNQITFDMPAYDVKVFVEFTEDNSSVDILPNQNADDPYLLSQKPESVSEEDWIAFRKSLEGLGDPGDYIEEVTLDDSYVNTDSVDDIMMVPSYQANLGDVSDETTISLLDVDSKSDYYVLIGDMAELNKDGLPDSFIVDEESNVAYVAKDDAAITIPESEFDAAKERLQDYESTNSGDIMPQSRAAVAPEACGSATAASTGITGDLPGYGRKTLYVLSFNGDHAFCLDPGLHATGARYCSMTESNDAMYGKAAGFMQTKIENDPGNIQLYYLGIQVFLWCQMKGVTDSAAVKNAMLSFYKSAYPNSNNFKSTDAVWNGYIQSVPMIYVEILTGISNTTSVKTFIWNRPGYDNYQRLLVWKEFETPDVSTSPTKVTIQKYSSDPYSTQSNSNYSLAGAKFEIVGSGVWDGKSYTDKPFNTVKKLVDKTYVVTTDSNGFAECEIKYEGNWEVSEISPSEGFTNAGDVSGLTFESAFSSGGELEVEGGSGYVVTVYEPVKYGSLKLVKNTSNGNISDRNNNYSLEGATYEFVNQDDSSGLSYIRQTDASGEIYLVNIPLGTYRIKELDSSSGYAINPNAWTVRVNWNGDNSSNYTVTNTKEVPQRRPVNILIDKYDTEQLNYHGSSDPQGDATLLNATFHFEFYSQPNLTKAQIEGSSPKTLMFEFDAKTVYKNGKNVVDISDRSTISNWRSTNGSTLDGMFDSASGSNFAVPYGTLYVYEKIPPVGYTLNDIYIMDGKTTHHNLSDANGTTRASYVWNNPDTGSGECDNNKNEVNTISYLNKITYSEESMILGSVEVTKRDNQNLDTIPQGNAKLWSRFHIYNMSAKPVWVDLDHNGLWDADEEFGPSELITTIYTDKNTKQAILAGNRDTQLYEDEENTPENVTELLTRTFTNWAGKDYSTGILPYGTYRILEVETDETYRLVPWEKTFTIGSHDNAANYREQLRYQSQIVKYNTVEENAPQNDVGRGTVVVTKYDNDFNEPDYAQGDASLAGAKFEIKNSSIQSVYDPDTRVECKPGEVFCYIVTDETGHASTIIRGDGKGGWKDTVVGDGGFLPIGTYTIREVEPPNGYRLNTTYSQKFAIAYDAQVVYLNRILDLDDTANTHESGLACGDDVQRAGIELFKSDNDRVNFLPMGDENVGQGDASLKGAVFGVINMSRHDVFINDQRFKHGSMCYTFITDENGYAASDLNTFPIGTYYIFEVMPPSGYFTDSSWGETVYVREDSKMYTVGDYDINPIKEAVYRAGIMGNKIDGELSKAYAQGDATLNGAEISIINRSKYGVYVEGKWYEPGEVCYVAKTTFSDYILAGEDSHEDGSIMEPGWWKTSKNLLPYGTYEIIETKASDGYNLNESYSVTVKIRKDNTWYDISKTSGTLPEQIIRGDVQIQKWDAELGKSEAIGGADHGNNNAGTDLNGIEFTVKNQSKHDIVYHGERIKSGEVVCVLTSHWNEEVGAYTAETTGKALPYGTYTIQETKTNSYYLLTDGEPKTFEIREEGKTVTVDSSGSDLVFKNNVVRGDIEFRKIADGTSARMSTLWVVSNYTTNERHVIAADQNGEYYSASDFNAHTNNTNGNDHLLDRIDANETIPIAEADFFSGLWFSTGENGSTSNPDDSRRALPYGHYRLQEVRTDSNEGYILQGIDFYIYRDNRVVDIGTITDDVEPKIPSIDTKARFVQEGDIYTTTDTVTYDGLTQKQSYRLEGVLMDYDTKLPVLDKDGKPLTSSKTFTPDSSSGTVDVTWTFDRSLTSAKRVVVFQTLYMNGMPCKIACHADFEDLDQTIEYPGIKDTDASDSETGGEDSKADGYVKIVDLVSYSGLTPGVTYICKGTLMDKDTMSEALDDYGNEITSAIIFTPTEPSGRVEVVFEFAGENLAGHTVVVFELIFVAKNGIGDASENITGDEIISGPGSKPDAGKPEIPNTGDDENSGQPDVGDDSTVSGNTPDKGDSEDSTKPDETPDDKPDDVPAEKPDEKPVEKPENPDNGNSGTIDKPDSGDNDTSDNDTSDNDTSDNDTSDNDDSEDVTKPDETPDDKPDEKPITPSKPLIPNGDGTFTDEDGNIIKPGDTVGDESDWDNPSQTIKFPKITTAALGELTGTHEGNTGTTTIRDTVTYKNLLVNESYVLTATLVDASTGKPLEDSNGDTFSESVNFIPTEEDGIAEIAIDINGDDFAGRTVVVFEALARNGVIVASHQDKDDKEQTMYFPKIMTKALANDTKRQDAIADKIKITDTVSYENVQIGQTYTVTGTLMDAESGGYIYEDVDSKEIVQATAKFTATETSGTVDVVFEGDATDLAGTTIVVYESLYDHNNIELARHNDVTDKTQYIYIPEIRTELLDSETGINEVMAKDTIKLSDTISYWNLFAGEEYIATTRLVDKATGKDIIEPVKKRFIPETEDGTVDVPITVENGKTFAGKSIVCYEYIAPADAPDYMVAKHEDIKDDTQTVTIPEIKTSAKSQTTGNNELIVGMDKIVDTVTYTNLRPGNTYTVTGTLMDKATGKAVLDSTGKEITAKSNVVPSEANGTVDVIFNVDTTKLTNHDLVVYESLTRDISIDKSIDLAKHEDINDEAQTVHVPEYSTVATFSTGIDEHLASDKITVNDTIHYKNLRVGSEYSIKATLMDVSSGAELKVGDKVISTTKSFTPTKEDDSVVVSIDFNASTLGGKNYVFYTELVRNKIELVADRRMVNEDETIHFPEIDTVLKSESGQQEVLAGSNVTLVDKITYRNLTPGREYKITGTLVKKSDGSTFATTDAKFKPTAPSGSVNMKFTQDTSSVAGDALVAYETISRDGQVVAEHKDIKDADQTVSFPKITTSAISKDTNSKMLSIGSETATLVDTVKYSNLIKGHSYTVTTTLMDKSTGKAVEMGNYTNTANTTFEAKETSGTFDVTMTVNPKALIGKDLVFFESMKYSDAVVAEHKDINDASQTVYVMGIDTAAFASDMRSKTIAIAKDTTVVDTLTFTNLVPNTKYYAHAFLMNKSTGVAVSNVTVEFTPTAANGKADIKIPVNTVGMNGVSLVAFEYVYDANGKLLASHEDLNDTDQTVTVQTTTVVQTGVWTYSTGIAYVITGIAVMAILSLILLVVIRKMRVKKAKKDSESEIDE